jgi:2'-5' RNA ligase superfamily
MLPGDRLICVLIEPRIPGYFFKDWLLHITVVPWFRVSNNSEKVVEDLTGELSGISPFNVVISKANVCFGHRKKPAALVRQPTPLSKIENLVRGYMHRQVAWLVDETTSRRKPLRPHVTNQISGFMHQGGSFLCDSLYVVEQKGGCKEIVGKIQLQ